MNPIDDGSVDIAEKNFKLIEKKIQKSFKALHSSHELIFKKIKNAKIKLAGDALYTIQAEITLDGTLANCTIKIREQPWRRHKNFELSCDDGKRTLNLKCQNLRHLTSQDIDDISKREVGDKLLQFLNEIADRGSDGFCLIEIEKVKVDVGEGTKYIIDGKIMKSDMNIVPCNFEIYELPCQRGSEIQMNCSKETFKLMKGRIS